MKILYIHNTLPEYRVGYFQELSGMCDLTIAFTELDLGEKVYKTKVDVRRLTRAKILYLKHDLKKDTKELKILIENSNFDFLIIPALDDIYSIVLSHFLLKMSKQKKIPTGIFWEKWRPEPKKQPIKRRIKEYVQEMLVRKILWRLDILWAPGIKTKEYYSRLCGKDKRIHKIHDASTCTDQAHIDIRKQLGIPDYTSIILYLGRLVEYKGADILVEAFANTEEHFRKTHWLVIAGSGPLEEKCRRIADKKSLTNISLAGYVEPQARSAYYQNSEIFVLPTKITEGKIEAWGLTVNEALQYNNFVITTTAVGAGYELIRDRNGLLIDENNVDELTKALERSENAGDCSLTNLEILSDYTYEQMAKDIIMGCKNTFNHEGKI